MYIVDKTGLVDFGLSSILDSIGIFLCIGWRMPHHYYFLKLEQNMLNTTELYCMYMEDIESLKEIKEYGQFLTEQQIKAMLAQFSLTGSPIYNKLGRFYVGDYTKREHLPCVASKNLVYDKVYLEEDLAYAIKDTHMLMRGDYVWLYRANLGGKYEWLRLDVNFLIKNFGTMPFLSQAVIDYKNSLDVFGKIYRTKSQRTNMVVMDETYSLVW
jgi:hypothetical protein